MLWRKEQQTIINWIDFGRDALLITGARQIGKTYLIEETLKQKECDYVTFNLIDNPEIIEVLKAVTNKDCKTFLERLTIATSHNLIKGKTILFFDEIQEYKEIVTKIKFLVQDNSFKYIFSGSLLGVELTNLKSAPVGFLSTVEMYPMNFNEFIVALNMKSQTIQSLKQSFIEEKPVDDYVHQKMLEAFKRYLLVGGMPEAVNTYIQENDFNKVSLVHKKIIEQYKKDFTKYEAQQRLKLIKTYELIPNELADKNKRYIFSDLDANLKFNRYENSFNWLIDAGVCIPVYNITEPKLPLAINKKSNLFKLFLSDVGLLTTLYGKSTQMAIMNDSASLNCGAIYENMIAEELNTHGFHCYYYNSHKFGELDFVIEYEDYAAPIEIKSGKDYMKHSALDHVLSHLDFGIKKAFVFSKSNILKKDKIIYYPIYMIMFLEEELDESMKQDLFDLSSL